MKHVLYRAITGAMMGFSLIAMFSIGYPFLLIGVVMLAVEAWRAEVRDVWAFTVAYRRWFFLNVAGAFPATGQDWPGVSWDGSASG